jgi:hypothetical protein
MLKEAPWLTTGAPSACFRCYYPNQENRSHLCVRTTPRWRSDTICSEDLVDLGESIVNRLTFPECLMFQP